MKEKINNLKIVLVVVLIPLTFLTCKKQEAQKSEVSNNIGLTKQQAPIDYLINSYATGGTIGCIIKYQNNRDNDKYEACMDIALTPQNKIPLPSGAIPWWEGRTDSGPCTQCDYNYEEYGLVPFFWSELGLIYPMYGTSYIEVVNKIENRLEGYNRIILAVFGNSQGYVVMPEDRIIQRSSVQAYFNANPDEFLIDDNEPINIDLPVSNNIPLPSPEHLDHTKENIIKYISLVYGKHFELRGRAALGVFLGNNPNSPDRFYGVKHNFDPNIL